MVEKSEIDPTSGRGAGYGVSSRTGRGAQRETTMSTKGMRSVATIKLDELETMEARADALAVREALQRMRTRTRSDERRADELARRMAEEERGGNVGGEVIL